MSKIDEFEQQIIENGFTEEDLKEYEKVQLQKPGNLILSGFPA